MNIIWVFVSTPIFVCACMYVCVSVYCCCPCPCLCLSSWLRQKSIQQTKQNQFEVKSSMERTLGGLRAPTPTPHTHTQLQHIFIHILHTISCLCLPCIDTSPLIMMAARAFKYFIKSQLPQSIVDSRLSILNANSIQPAQSGIINSRKSRRWFR